jgi:hypothetical protein
MHSKSFEDQQAEREEEEESKKALGEYAEGFKKDWDEWIGEGKES